MPAWRTKLSCSCHPLQHGSRHPILNSLAAEKPFQVIQYHARDACPHSPSAPSDMRGNNRACHGPQGISRGKRFLWIGHVEGTTQSSALHYGSESVQVDQTTTGNVDNTSAVGKVRQILPTQETPGLFGQRRRQDEHMSLG